MSLSIQPISLYVYNYLQYWCVFGVIVVVSRYYLINRRFYQLASKIPGNPTWPIIGNGFEFMTDLSKILYVVQNIVNKFDGIVRIWLGPYLCIIITRPEDLEVYYNDPRLLNKGSLYGPLTAVLGQGLITSNGDVWKRHRRLISPTFQTSNLKTFVGIFWENCRTLTSLLDGKANLKEPFNVFPYIRNCTFDFIIETATDKQLEVQHNSLPHVTEAAEKLMAIVTKRILNIHLRPSWIFSLTRDAAELKKSVSIIRARLFENVEEKKREVEYKIGCGDNINNMNEDLRRKHVFLNQFLQLHEEDSLTEEELYDEIMTILIAGYETSAATTSFILMLLGIHQDIQERVYAEILSANETMKGDVPQAEDLKKLVYTEMVINETLRLFPVAPITARKCSDDVQIGKYLIPKGADVIAFSYSTHRNPEIWNEPNKFNPDNFLPENVAKRPPYSFVPFAAGRRNCVGQKYAILSMKVMIFAILSRYRVFCDMKLEDISLKVEITLKDAGPSNIRLESRNMDHRKEKKV